MDSSMLPDIFLKPQIWKRNQQISQPVQKKRLSVFWYPSADYDYRPLTFCHPQWQKQRGL